MRRSLQFLIGVAIVAGLTGGCARQAGVPSNVPGPEHVDLKKAKKLKMPVVIYHIAVEKDEGGKSYPVVYFLNTSTKPVTIVTYHVEGHTKSGETVGLWADDYEKVPPGKPSVNGRLGGSWNRTDIDCVTIRRADLEIGGETLKFNEATVAQLFQDPKLNTCH